MTRDSLKLRLALLVGVLGLAQAIAVLLFAYFTFEQEMQSHRVALLRDKAQQARYLLKEMRNESEVRDNAFRLVELVTGRADLHMAVAGPGQGQAYVAFSPEAAESLQRLRSDTWQTNGLLEWRASRGNGAMLSLAEAGQTKDGRPYELVLTMDRSEDVRVLRELLLTAATVAPLALAIVSLSALLIVALGLKPLVTFKKAVEGITARSLKQRVAAQHLPEELRELGLAFNMMLDRLDDAVTRLTQFSDDLAHEMRTPVATLLGRTQVALSSPRTSDELVDVMEGNIEELQRLSRLVSDMLFLARAEHAREALDLQELELAQEARHVAEFLELAAQQREMSITIEGEGRVRGDRGLVQRAITNLLTNALRHGTPGSTVRVTVCTQKEQVTMEVVNRGVPIQPEHMERIFDRFYRTDDSRGRDRGGTGLGLAVVRAIMELHLGSALVATDREKGQVRFSLRFPRGSTPAVRA